MDLPLNVHLLTLERLDHDHHLLRLEHQYPIDEAPLNTTVNVTLEVSLFPSFLTSSLSTALAHPTNRIISFCTHHCILLTPQPKKLAIIIVYLLPRFLGFTNIALTSWKTAPFPLNYIGPTVTHRQPPLVPS